MFAKGYNQCSDDPMGTYITPVPTFVDAYLEQVEEQEQDKGNDDYATPDSAQYTQCTRMVIQNQEYYVMLGCTDGTSQSISVNIYTDDTCETRSTVNGYDDANIDVSDIEVSVTGGNPWVIVAYRRCSYVLLIVPQIPFKRCKLCVNWVDLNDDQVDDQYYENHQMIAPLCSTAWQNKESCDRTCQKTGLEAKAKEGWNTPDKILLTILTLFGKLQARKDVLELA